jgi:predicted ATPase
MHISTIQIRNYKSFYDSQEIHLTAGFNIVVGQNNVGKTALAEALSLTFEDKPHRSLKTFPMAQTPVAGRSSVSISFVFSGEELTDVLLNRFNDFYLLSNDSNADVPDRKFRNMLSSEVSLDCVYHHDEFLAAYFPSYDASRNIQRGINLSGVHFVVDRASRIIERASVNTTSHSGLLNFRLANLLREDIYMFRAERLNIGVSAFGLNTELSTDARNLAEVLHILQSNPSRFRRYNDLIATIFPEVHSISVPPGPVDGKVQILIWEIDPGTERVDLAMPLAESGTGIGQVLAILYVVLMSDHPRTIIIDEPQSFLHPGAARKLIEILKGYPQHQFVIMTHSPIALTAANPSTLLLVRKEGVESRVDAIDVRETRELRAFLSEVGASFSDVFGADHILWVEGATEEQCFPRILEKLSETPLLGTVIMGVKQTGDLSGKQARTAFEIYERLSQGQGLLPPAVGFIFDQEGRSPTQREDLSRQSKGLIFFIPRRMYENYLIDAHAIAAVASSIEGFRDRAITPTEIEGWLNEHRWERKYFKNRILEAEKVEQTDVFWNKNVHGAEVLEDIFKHFSENRINFDKVVHGVALTDWLLESKPEYLAEVARLLERVLSLQN